MVQASGKECYAYTGANWGFGNPEGIMSPGSCRPLAGGHLQHDVGWTARFLEFSGWDQSPALKNGFVKCTVTC